MLEIEEVKLVATTILLDFWEKHKHSYFAQTFEINGFVTLNCRVEKDCFIFFEIILELRLRRKGIFTHIVSKLKNAGAYVIVEAPCHTMQTLCDRLGIETRD